MMIDLNNISFSKLATDVSEFLKERQATLATAESCTGGWVSQVITSISGSSTWFDRGFVTYSNAAKEDMLGVSSDTLRSCGAVSKEIVIEMALGALEKSNATYSLAITGIAGPTGGTPDKPVGLVWFAWANTVQGVLAAESQQFEGDRDNVRARSVSHVLKRLMEL